MAGSEERQQEKTQNNVHDGAHIVDNLDVCAVDVKGSHLGWFDSHGKRWSKKGPHGARLVGL